MVMACGKPSGKEKVYFLKKMPDSVRTKIPPTTQGPCCLSARGYAAFLHCSHTEWAS